MSSIRTKRHRVKRKFKKVNVDDFEDKYGDVLGPYLTELCKMKLNNQRVKQMRYSHFQKWLAVNFMVSCSINGYKFLARIFCLPSPCTISRFLENLKSQPGIIRQNVQSVKIKVNPTHERDKLCFLLMDEMSIKEGVTYDQKTGTLYGFCDTGEQRTSKLSSSVLCIMAVGVVRKWKYPIGFFFTDKVTSSEFITKVVTTSVAMMEEEGFHVMGFTSDQGSNFEKTFRLLGAKPSAPYVNIDDKRYFVHKDPPHLIKNARNFLEKNNVHVPGNSGTASWKDVEGLYEIDSKNTLRLCPKLTDKHIHGLKFANKMKVKLASQVLSHSVSSGLLYAKSYNLLGPHVLTTASYCKRINDIFDALNSTSCKEVVQLRRPLHMESSTINFLKESVVWLQKLERNNNKRVKFISGFIQAINVVLLLNEKLTTDYEVPYLSTRNICQDPLELFFCKVRHIAKYPTSYDFAKSYGKITAASLMMAPRSGNCELESDHLDTTLQFITAVSIY